MLHTYYRHREGRTIRQYELENFLYLYRRYKALGGNSFIDRIKSEIDEWEVFLIAVCVLCAVVVLASVLAILAQLLGVCASATGTSGRRFST